MTQPELAEALDVSTRQLQNYEAGVTIPWPHFQRLEEIFDRSLTWFLHGEDKEDAQTPEAQEEHLRSILHEELSAVVATLLRLEEDLRRLAPPDDGQQKQAG